MYLAAASDCTEPEQQQALLWVQMHFNKYIAARYVSVLIVHSLTKSAPINALVHYILLFLTAYYNI